MKKTILLLSASFILSIVAGCNDHNGNTGNGANDPTSEYEPNNLKDDKDARLQGRQDSTVGGATMDTTGTEK